ncbi:hypothetical protein [Streptomyces sp. IBSBF 2806]|uniref:hypothetical protein n=1 Tax=Streptomyces sp. IBSBF 2806 TaxID=2903529 RepID=UPI002FDBFBAF
MLLSSVIDPDQGHQTKYRLTRGICANESGDQVLADETEDLREAHLRARTEEHRAQLDAVVAELLDEHRLRLHFEEIVHHDDNDSLRQRLVSSA